MDQLQLVWIKTLNDKVSTRNGIRAGALQL